MSRLKRSRLASCDAKTRYGPRRRGHTRENGDSDYNDGDDEDNCGGGAALWLRSCPTYFHRPSGKAYTPKYVNKTNNTKQRLTCKKRQLMPLISSRLYPVISTKSSLTKTDGSHEARTSARHATNDRER